MKAICSTSLLIFALVISEKVCENYCRCAQNTCTCNGENKSCKMDYIPKFPEGTINVTFVHNNIEILSREIFRNISGLPIRILDLKFNNISFIANDTFVDFTRLEQLDISGNDKINIKIAAESFHSISKSTLKRLALNHMLWHPYDDIFEGLSGSSVTRIELSHSYLFPFNGTWFESLHNLTELDISWNSIKDDFSFQGLWRLTFLSLIGNWFNIIPNFCQNGSTNLEILYLSNTKLWVIDGLRNYSKCLQKLTNLNLNGLSIANIQNNVFSDLKSLKVLTMQQMSTQLKNIFPYAFNSSTLEELSFSRCDGFDFFSNQNKIKKNFDSENIFKHSPNLVKLDLSKNRLEFTSSAISDMFNPLKKLKEIFLNAINLAYMPENVFQNLPLLEKIFLNNNLILSWKNGANIFGDLRNLREIHLKDNKIGMIYATSFPPNVLQSLQVLDLSYNNFKCTCELMWFRDWIKSTRVNFTDKEKYRCDNVEGKHTRLIDYNPTVEDCHILLISVSVGCGVAIFLLTTIIIYFCRWRIRFCLYNMRSFRKVHHKLVNDDEYIYSAYIIYCDEDLKWVKGDLIKKIERDRGFKLCIPHRDFELGKVFADNIVDHMNLSKTVIPVLSNKFSRNEWCLFQLAVARSKISKEGKLSILPVVLEEIKFKNMNSALYYLIKLSKYAAWDEDENAVELFWDQISDYLKNCL